MRKITAGAMLFLGASLVGAPSALALNPQPEPPGAVVGQVTAVLFRALPPNPCVRLEVAGIVLPPNPCLGSGR